MGTWGYLCLLLDVSLCQDDTKRIRWSGLALPCPCAPSQLEGQVTTLSQEVTRLQGQCKQESSQAKVWKLLPFGSRLLSQGGVDHGFSSPCLAPLHMVKTIHAAPETNGIGAPEGQSQEAQLRKEVAALREQLEHACSQG